jgi:excisionase family DNA binding protein
MPDRFMDASCQTLSLAEAAQVLGIGRSTAYKLARQGALPVPVLEIGPVLRVSAVHLERYLATAVPIRPENVDQAGGE